jgi:hypothetical protein
MRDNFREWVRVKIAQPFANQEGVVEGSRSSEMIKWHLLNYTKSESPNGHHVLDTDATSICDPAYISATHPSVVSRTSAVTVTPLPAAETELFVAVYDSTYDAWLIVGSSGAPTTANRSGSGADAIWHANVGNKVAITIKTNMITFNHGDKLLFNVFKSQVKGNSVGFGHIDLFDIDIHEQQ